jgi:Domain of unknown function (DU1801)
MSNPPKDLLDLLKRYNSDVQELVLALREVVLDELAPCHENIMEVYIISLAYSASERALKDGICYIGVLKDRVNLGFNHGTDLRDPYGLMEGTGKSMRHIKIRHMSDALNPALRTYLQEARERVGHDKSLGTKRTVTISVKRKSAAKRLIGRRPVP